MDTISTRERRQSILGQLVEVIIFLFLFTLSLGMSVSGASSHVHKSFASVSVATIIRDIIFVILVFLLIRRTGDSSQNIGWGKGHFWRELGLGIALYIPFLLLSDLATIAFKLMGLKTPSQPVPKYLVPHTAGQFVLAVLLVITAAIAEETIFRGYLLLRLSRILSSIGLAVIVSSFLFAIGHGYEGSAGMAAVGTMGILFSLVYLWRKSLVAPITMHFLQDFIGIVLLPLLSHK